MRLLLIACAVLASSGSARAEGCRLSEEARARIQRQDATYRKQLGVPPRAVGEFEALIERRERECREKRGLPDRGPTEAPGPRNPVERF